MVVSVDERRYGHGVALSDAIGTISTRSDRPNGVFSSLLIRCWAQFSQISDEQGRDRRYL